MYNEEFEKLIDLALVDGVLTEKEKQVLFKKAEGLGVDLDEFEMVLEAKLFEKQKSQPQPKQTEVAPKSNKFGNIKKCPACGEIKETFSTKCGACGTEFMGAEGNRSIQKLFDLLNDVKGKGILGLSNADEKRKQIIATFPIPNTKEDIVEFLSLALPKATIVEGNYLQTAWEAKCEQVMIKARFLLKNDPCALEEVEKMYSLGELKKIKKQKEEYIYMFILIILLVGMFTFIFMVTE